MFIRKQAFWAQPQPATRVHKRIFTTHLNKQCSEKTHFLLPVEKNYQNLYVALKLITLGALLEEKYRSFWVKDLLSSKSK